MKIKIPEHKLQNPPLSKLDFRLLGIGGIILFTLVCAGFGFNYFINNLSIATTTMPSLKDTPTLKPYTSTSIPFTPTSQPTKTPSPTQTPGIGSTMIPEKSGRVMVYVPAGEFTMGSDNGDEAPIHAVYLDSFWIGQTEVTNKQYSTCVIAGICIPPYPSNSYSRSSYYSNPDFYDYPVINVSWYMAKTYCEWVGGRLPSDAEWEKAARGIYGRIYPWGEDISCEKANFYYHSDCFGDTRKVGSYLEGVSPYGTYDMAGNVYEWVNDWYDKTYFQNSLSFKNPSGPDLGQYRVLRGGSWRSSRFYLRTTLRIEGDPTNASNSIGFRCARSP